MTRRIKQGATSPALTMTLQETTEAGVTQALDVSTATTITVDIKSRDRNTVAVENGTCSYVTDGTDGQVTYSWSSGDTDTTGGFDVEVVVTWPDSTVTKFPDEGYGEVHITDDL